MTKVKHISVLDKDSAYMVDDLGELYYVYKGEAVKVKYREDQDDKQSLAS